MNGPSPSRAVPVRPADPDPQPDQQLETNGKEPLVVQMPIDIRNAALTVLAVLAIILLLRMGQELFIPIVLASLVAYALNPIVNRLNEVGAPRLLAVVLVLAVVLSGLGWGGYRLSGQMMAVVDQLPDAAQQVRGSLAERRRTGDGALEKVQRAADEIERAAEETAAPRPRVTPGGATRVRVEEAPFDVRSYLWGASLNIGLLGAQAAMVLFLVFFLLLSGDLFKRKLVRIVGPQLSTKKVTVQILDEINWQIGRYLLVRIGTSAVVGVATGMALWLIGLEQAAVWGVMAGVLNTIPYFGPFIVTALVGVAGFLQFQTLGMAAYVAGVTLLITALEGWLLTPPLLGKAARMNAVAIFVSLIFWSWMWTVWGLILAVPIMVVIKSICDRIDDLQPVGELLGD
jgi:predicted PurR-regulated permease PerM